MPLASFTTATIAPLATLAVPETCTGELMAVPPSGLSMTIRSPFGIGVTAVVGSEDDAGEAAELADAEAADEELDAEALESTNVVLLSPPQPERTVAITTSPLTAMLFTTSTSPSSATVTRPRVIVSQPL